MPICNYEGDVIGVAQIINKTNGEYFFIFFNICFSVGRLEFFKILGWATSEIF